MNEVELKRVEEGSAVLSETYYQLCDFCNKAIRFNQSNEASIKHISGGKPYCAFCLRNNHHHRPASNVLIVSFRAVLGYYYYRLYCGTPRRLWLSDIHAILDKQAAAGLAHPAFNYDPQSLLWFLDFNRIGTDPRKAPFPEVKSVLKSVFDCLNVPKIMTPYVASNLWEKYDKAVMLFYETRKRPKDRRMLIPTLHNCPGVSADDEFFEDTREFTRHHMHLV